MSESHAGRVPAVVLGGTGYVAGDLLRLIAGHPRLELKAILSDSQPGSPVAAAPVVNVHSSGSAASMGSGE